MFDRDEGFAQLLREFAVGREVEFVVLKNSFVDEGLEQIIDVVAAEMRVAIRRENLIDVAFGGGNQFEYRDIEGAAAQIVNRYSAPLLFVQTIRQRCGGRLIHQAKDFEPRDLSGVFGGLTLCVVEIGGDGDDGAVNGFAEMRFGPAFQFAQDERGNFRRCENSIAQHDADDVLACGIDAERKQLQFALHIGRAAAHEALNRIDRAFGLSEQAVPCGFANNDAAIRIEADDGRAERRAVRPLNTLRLARLRIDIRDEAVGRSQVDANDASHVLTQISPNSLATLVTRFRMYERRFRI